MTIVEGLKYALTWLSKRLMSKMEANSGEKGAYQAPAILKPDLLTPALPGSYGLSSS